MFYFRLIMRLQIVLALVCLGPDLLAKQDVCPAPHLVPDEVLIETNNQADQRTPFVDNSRPIKDLGTDIVVKDFFNTPESLYNFMKFVYTKIDNSLDKYKEKNDLDKKSISLLFKGGNVLRIVANGIIDMLPKKAAQLLIDEYAPDFKRSDADFTVYIDENKLKSLDYDRVIGEVSDLVLSDLDQIREEFKTNAIKYFDFLKLKPYEAKIELRKYFKELEKLPILADEKNQDWFKAKFKQIQLLQDRARLQPACKYFGQFDYRFVTKDNKIVGIPLSDKPNWIINTDNRTLEWPMGADPKKIVKFNLVRSKVAFEYTYEKDGELYRKPIGGELIDVSIPHRKDATIREFLDNYDQNITEYILASSSKKDKFAMKAYSLSSLSHDLLNILFGQFDRPWNGGPKYGKRLNRLFFLGLIELMGSYGLGSQSMKNYLAAAREKIIDPLTGLYPLGKDSSKTVDILKDNADLLAQEFPEITPTNDFWQKLVVFVKDELINNPKRSDKEEFQVLIDIIKKNFDIADDLSKIKFKKINPSDVYNTDMDKLF